MNYTLFTIKGLFRGRWRFYCKNLEGGDQWDEDLYVATQFKSEQEAEDFLMDKIQTKNWGGFYSIEKYFVSK